MVRSNILRSMLFSTMCLFMPALVPTVARASGGGGCGAPVTDGTGTAVEIDQFCFSPTIVRTEPGAVVTFVNRDPFAHGVLGAQGAWGSWDALKRGREISFRFTQAGVFPYICPYHVGMVGAVVVGDGIGGAIDTTTANGPVVQVSAKQAAELPISPVAATSTPGSSSAAGPLAVVIGLAVVVGVVAVRRSRRRSIA